MNLLPIGLMALAALGVWLLRGGRATALLVLSVAALYALQPAGALNLALPTATLLLVVGVWWLLNPAPGPEDGRALLLIGFTAALFPTVFMVGNLTGLTLQGAVGFLAPLGAVAVGAAGAGALVPAQDEAARRRLALGFMILVILLLAILKTPALQAAASGVLSQVARQPIGLDWQWLGFSYIAFRLLHVLIDYRSGKLAGQGLSLRDFALYVAFFPALSAGPIDRVERFVKDLNEPKTLDAARILDGGARIGIGLLKKFVLADTLAYLALSPRLAAESTSAGATPLAFWIMLYAFSFRLFLDFSGYTDIAIGIGRLAGISLPENFAAPYSKPNITAFWNSWHMTLSNWFRVYFFTPFSRLLMQTPLRASRMGMILAAQVSTMVLIGLWHGVAWNFVLWGAWHGLGLWLHRLLTDRTRALGWDDYVAARPRLADTIRVLSTLATFHFVTVGWVFFALPDLSLIGKTLGWLLGVAR